MSATAYQVINALPGIERLRYLELGVAGGSTFSRVLAKHKVGVDIVAYPASQLPTFLMWTDAFFAAPGRAMTWDVAFIDACHHYPFVRRDFNNVVQRLAPGGIVFVHDLLPPEECDTSPERCWDGYNLLLHLVEDGQLVAVQDGDFGLTAVREPKPIPANRRQHTYRDLQIALQTNAIVPLPLDAFIQTVRQWRLEPR